jgi:flagellar basal-body rod protein FlgC
MISAITIARSGLLASVARLNAGAGNIANAGTTGPLPQGQAAPEDGPRVYEPVDVVLKSVGGREGETGVAASYRLRAPSYVLQHDPAAPFSDAQGNVAAPNVDLAEEAAGVLDASLLFRANLAVLKRADEMTKSLLDVIA